MPKGDPIAFVLCALASILLLIAAAFAFSMRPINGKPNPLRQRAWSHLLMSACFGLKSAQEYHPYPKNIHNPHVAAWGILLIFTVLYGLQELESRRKAKQLYKPETEVTLQTGNMGDIA